MRLEEYTAISDSVKFMTDEQLVKFSDLVRMNINVRRMKNKVEVEGCEKEAARLKNNIEVLSGARIGDTVRERLDRKPDLVDKVKRQGRVAYINALKEQGVEVGKGYRKNDFMKRIAKTEISDEEHAEGAVKGLIGLGLIVTSKGWYRFSDEATRLAKVTHE